MGGGKSSTTLTLDKSSSPCYTWTIEEQIALTKGEIMVKEEISIPDDLKVGDKIEYFRRRQFPDSTTLEIAWILKIGPRSDSTDWFYLTVTDGYGRDSVIPSYEVFSRFYHNEITS